MIFLSHNSGDKRFTTELGSALTLLGANVWLDSWKLRPGDSLPDAVNAGIEESDIFCLVWSKRAARSKWVGSERSAGYLRTLTGQTRLIPVVLDSEPLPALIAPLKYVIGRRRKPIDIAAEVLGLNTPNEIRRAVQGALDRAGLRVQEFWGAGTLVGCPDCGADLDSIRGYQCDDEENDRRYAGAQCTACGWDAGSEL